MNVRTGFLSCLLIMGNAATANAMGNNYATSFATKHKEHIQSGNRKQLSKDTEKDSLTFEESIVIRFSSPSGIQTVDMNQDGYADILVTSSEDDGIAWFENNGKEQIHWIRHDIDTTLNNALYAYAGDINSDHQIDVVVASMRNNEISWYENKPGGTQPWAKHRISDQFKGAHEVILVDIDLNGTLDILAAGAGSGIGLWLNSGEETIHWHAQAIDREAPGARSVTAADLDRDGDIDIVSASLLSNELSWYKNENGRFMEISIDNKLRFAHRVFLADMDNDGDQDICAVGTGNKNLFWYENVNNGETFWLKHEIPDAFGPKLMIHAADLNNDGQKDLVTTAFGAGDVKWLRNLSPENEEWESINLNLNFPQAWPLSCCDMDNDGDMDIVAGGTAANEIRLWRNNLHPTSNRKPDAIISASSASTVVGGNITFQSTSTGKIEKHKWFFGQEANPAKAIGPGPHTVSFPGWGIKPASLIVSGPMGADSSRFEISVDSVLQAKCYPSENLSLCVGDSVVLHISEADSASWEPSTYLDNPYSPVVLCKPGADIHYTVTVFQGILKKQISVEVHALKTENDDIENAILLNLGENAPFDNFCATAQINEPHPPLNDCQGQASWCNEGGVQNSVWFRLKAPKSENLKIQCYGFDSQIALYEADSPEDLLEGKYTLLYANDDINPKGESEITRAEGLQANKTYWLQVDGSLNGSRGSFTLRLTALPANDSSEELKQ